MWLPVQAVMIFAQLLAILFIREPVDMLETWGRTLAKFHAAPASCRLTHVRGPMSGVMVTMLSIDWETDMSNRWKKSGEGKAYDILPELDLAPLIEGSMCCGDAR